MRKVGFTVKLTTKTVEKLIAASQARFVTEDAPRGEGRLALRVRGNLAEWMLQYFHEGQRRLLKLGNATGDAALSLAEAREKMKPYRQHILDGLDPKVEGRNGERRSGARNSDALSGARSRNSSPSTSRICAVGTSPPGRR
jgi:hypothetical protein